MTCLKSLWSSQRGFYRDGAQQLNAKIEREKKEFQEARITTIALGLIALFLAGIGLILMGIGTMPSTMSVGFGIFPYLIGSQLGILSSAVLVSAALFTAIGVSHYLRLQSLERRYSSTHSRVSMIFK